MASRLGTPINPVQGIFLLFVLRLSFFLSLTPRRHRIKHKRMLQRLRDTCLYRFIGSNSKGAISFFFFFFLSLPNRSLEVSVPSRTRERARENFPNFFPISFDDVERPPRYNDKERATTTRKKTRNVNTNKKEKRGARKTKQRKGRRTS